jgi:hypothetical protein
LAPRQKARSQQDAAPQVLSTEIRAVYATLRAPSGSDPGQVSQGWYRIEGNFLQMLTSKGDPIADKRFRVRLQVGQDHQSIARELTREIRREALGSTAETEAFNRPMNFERIGLA